MRQLLVPLPADLPDKWPLDAATVHRLARVLRLPAGARVLATDGCGRQVPAEFSGRALRFSAPAKFTQPPLLQVQIACAVLKGDRFDWLVEKCAELGVSALQPLQTAHGVVRLDAAAASTKQARWQALADAALEQCGRPWRTVVRPACTLKELAIAKDYGDRRWFADERAGAPALLAALAGCPLPAGILRATVVVGPEGGLADDERDCLKSAGFSGVSLADAVLRAETAALAVAVIAGAAEMARKRPLDDNNPELKTNF